MDGASRSNPGQAMGGGGEGGILCDYCGRIVFSFSYFYDIQTNTIVEAMAIRDGLLLCETRNL